ncbi:MAG: hypothetical protein Q4B60_06185 [Erysipelotrichaceae bacterium]|nr:hypothetical protein [Erysipelotrichaceae bacterium]
MEFSIPMALLDYVPVILFLIGAVILQRELYYKMSKGAFALFSAGTIDVFMAGFLKATYKLLYAANICDFDVLSKIFFPVQALGFMLMGVAMIALLIHPKQGQVLSVAAPAVFSGTFIFVIMMCFGLGVTDFALATYARKLKKNNLVIFFILAFVFSLCMGYLSSKDFSQGFMNYIAEIINTLGQLFFMLGALGLKKAGLKDLDL